MITNPEDLGSPAAESPSNNNEYETKPLQHPQTPTEDLSGVPGNPFEGQRYEDEFDLQQQMPPQDQHQQHHHAHQQYYGYGGYQQQHHQQWQQQQHYPPQHHHHQQQQQHQMYPQHHDQYHHHQQHQQQQHHGYPPPGYGGMYMYNGTGTAAGGTAATGATSPNGGAPQGTATPSPTTNSDDSGGDCVNESKRMIATAHTIHPEVGHTAATVHPGAHGGHPYYASAPARGVPMVQKRPRQTRRSKKKRDPNEPQKPVSAYALFFRDMQAGIKARNPNASFGEVSKHVASMWDNLNPDHKAAYKKRTENAKKEYLKALAAYRANLVSKNHGDPYGPYSSLASYYKTSSGSTYDPSTYTRGHLGMRMGASSSAANHGPHGTPQSASEATGMSSMERPSSYGQPQQQQQQQTHNNMPQHSPSTSTSVPSHTYSAHVGPTTPTSQGSTGRVAGRPGETGAGSGQATQQSEEGNVCRRSGCPNTVLDFSTNGFCSNECVLSQSREVYNSWSNGAPVGAAPAAACR